MKDSINGFSCEEVMVLYQFLDYYEKKISQLKNNKSLDVSGFNKLVKEGSILLVKVKSTGDFKNVTANTVVLTIQKKNQLLSFLAHLRNSIAHAYISKAVDGRYCLADYYHSKINMQGFVSKETIESIINQIVK